MKKYNKYLNDEDRVEIGRKFLGSLVPYLKEEMYTKTKGLVFINVIELLMSISQSIRETIVELLEAVRQDETEYSDVLKIKTTTEKVVASAYRVFKAAKNEIEAAIWKNEAISKVEEERIMSILFPLGLSNNLKTSLKSLSTAMQTLVNSLNEYEFIRSTIDMDNLLKHNEILTNAFEAYKIEQAESELSKQRLIQKRQEFDNVWKAAKSMVTGIQYYYELPENTMATLFSDRDPKWLSGRTSYAKDQETTDTVDIQEDNSGQDQDLTTTTETIV